MAQASERPRRKRLSWESRCEIVGGIEQGMSPPLAAASGGASRATGYRLWRRYQAGGWMALRDRPSTPLRQPRHLSADEEQRIISARWRSSFGPVRLAGVSSRIRRRRSARCCAVTATRGCPGQSKRPLAARVATSASGRASCCTSTRNGWAGSGNRASGCSARTPAARIAIDASAGNTFTSRSTTTPASAMPNCCPAKTPTAARASSSAQSPGTASAASRSSECSPTTPRPTTRAPGCKRLSSSRSSAATRASIGHARTERPNASSKHCSANGLTPAATAQAHNEPVP